MGKIIGIGIIVLLVVLAEILSKRNGNGKARDRLLSELDRCLEQATSVRR